MAHRQKLLIVDGYNVLGAWPEVSKGRPLADARDELTRRLHDYAGYTGQQVILVFDAWQSERLARTEENHGLLRVVFTQKGEMADHYIERLCDEHARRVELGKLELRVATSDGLEQTIILGRGATRMSARELWRELNAERSSGRDRHQMPSAQQRTALAAALSREQYELLDKLRRHK